MAQAPAQSPELLALADVCARLDGADIAYMLTGSLAMSYYARPRMTRDIDLVIALEAVETKRLVGALGADYHAEFITAAGVRTVAEKIPYEWQRLTDDGAYAGTAISCGFRRALTKIPQQQFALLRTQFSQTIGQRCANSARRHYLR